jgi:hypothetical protein
VQGIAEEARGVGSVQALAVGGLPIPLAIGEVVLLRLAAVGGSEQGPAAGGELKGGLQGSEGGVLLLWD